MLWTDADTAAFVRDHYPDRADFFHALPLAVHRWDLFRYMLLHTQGGLYLDMDIEPSRSFAELLGPQRQVLPLAFRRGDGCVRTSSTGAIPAFARSGATGKT